MGISLSPDTERLIRERMKQAGVESPDELVRLALQTLDQVRGDDYDALDAETRAAIEAAEADFAKGQAVPWESVREKLRSRFIKD